MGLFNFKKAQEAQDQKNTNIEKARDNVEKTYIERNSKYDSGKKVIDGGIVVRALKTTKDAVLPTKAYDDDSTYDLTSIDCHFDHDHQAYVYATGLILQVPEGYVVVIRPRASSIANGLFIPEAGSRIYSNFRGEVHIPFKSTYHKSFPQPYPVGDIVAQIHLEAIPEFLIEEVEQLTATERGSSAFGSTDISE